MPWGKHNKAGTKEVVMGWVEEMDSGTRTEFG